MDKLVKDLPAQREVLTATQNLDYFSFELWGFSCQ